MIITLIIIFLQPWSIPYQAERHFWKNAKDWGASSQWPSGYYSWNNSQSTWDCQYWLLVNQDLKLSDCLRYHMRDTNAAKDLLYRWLCEIVQPFAPFTTLGTNIYNEVFKKWWLCRRLRCLANYEKANKDLDMARARNKDVALAENK